jgi:hypothetical protein
MNAATPTNARAVADTDLGFILLMSIFLSDVCASTNEALAFARGTNGSNAAAVVELTNKFFTLILCF